MPETTSKGSLDRVVTAAAQDVLETMFFSVLDEDSAEASPDEAYCAGVSFGGTFAGRLEICLTGESARTITSDFLGLSADEEVSAELIRPVVGEMANMICGTVLSRLDSKGRFNLAAPEPMAELSSANENTLCATLPLEQGPFSLRFVTI